MMGIREGIEMGRNINSESHHDRHANPIKTGLKLETQFHYGFSVHMINQGITCIDGIRIDILAIPNFKE